ncbi:DUF4012 domain-containing protein [Patescibacteria group bacterium]|nr:DUF4012 domain-containing protein [Patescibacteria group bacterium]
MKKSPKQTSVKINPLKGKFFDIKPPKGKRSMPLNNKWKSFKYFVILAIIVFVGLNISNIYFKGMDFVFENKDIAMAGYDQLQKAIDYSMEGNYEKASTWFEEAEISFNQLAEDTKTLTLQSDELNTESLYLDTANKLIESGVIIAQLGQDLVNFIDSASLIPQTFIKQNLDGTSDIKITTLIKEEKENLDVIYSQILELQQNITTLNSGLLPGDVQIKLKKGQEQIAQIITLLRELNLNFDTILTMLGDEVPHRYMVLMQNNHEIRGTGGFIGSYMIIDVNDGAITKMEAKDVYESDGQLTEVVEPPTVIRHVVERLYLRDSNYSPDFPTSAKLIMWFLEHSQQPSIDTIIAIDQNVVEEILKITGPIHLEHFPFQIKSESFNNLISYYIEAKISQTSTPKQLLFDFIPVFKEKVLTTDNMIELKDAIIDLAGSRHIQAYSNDSDIQKLITRLELDGKMMDQSPKTDYLAVISSSIGGNKSDGFIKMNIDHETTVHNSGVITDKLTIEKEHTWDIDDIPELNSLIERYGTGELDLKSILFILGKGRNLDYIRIYVPKGSLLTNVEGIEMEDVEITEDLGYTVFAFIYGPIEAGENMEIALEYDLPFNLNFTPEDNYEFVAQKQAGVSNVDIKKTVEIIGDLNFISSTPASISPFSIKPIVETELDEDFEFSSVISNL